MANQLAIHSVGSSLVAYLTNTYPQALKSKYPCTFRLISSGELAAEQVPERALTLLLHRITINEQLRNSGRRSDEESPAVQLSVNLHYLISAWYENAESEHVVLAWTMAQFHRRPLLDRSLLSPAAAWESDDVVQFVPEEVSIEEMQRIWGDLRPSYRLSASYVARGVRIDPGLTEEVGPPVVSTRLRHGIHEGVGMEP